MSRTLISRNHSIIPACDLSDMNDFVSLVKGTSKVPGVGAYKIGFSLALRYGLKNCVEVVRDFAGGRSIPVIYDHQKAGTDIPDTGKDFAKLCKEAGVSSVILFPFTGPKTQLDWTKECENQGLHVIIGGHMTHEQFIGSENGYIIDSSPFRIYDLAISSGIRDFVVPGNKPQVVKELRDHLEKLEVKDYDFYSPGFVAQGGELSETGKVAGSRWHPIIGRAITNKVGEMAPQIYQDRAETLAKQMDKFGT